MTVLYSGMINCQTILYIHCVSKGIQNIFSARFIVFRQWALSGTSSLYPIPSLVIASYNCTILLYVFMLSISVRCWIYIQPHEVRYILLNVIIYYMYNMLRTKPDKKYILATVASQLKSMREMRCPWLNKSLAKVSIRCSDTGLSHTRTEYSRSIAWIIENESTFIHSFTKVLRHAYIVLYS